MEYRPKRRIIVIGIIVVFLSLLLGIAMITAQRQLYISYVLNEEGSSEGEIEKIMRDENGITVVVYTYSGEVYEINGNVKKYLSESESADSVVEVNGTMKSREMQEDPTHIEEKFDNSNPCSIMVYTTSGEIYGFQTNHEVVLQSSEDENKIELYGYLVGYYDGEEYYS